MKSSTLESEFADGSEGHVVDVLPAGWAPIADETLFCPGRISAQRLTKSLTPLGEDKDVGVMRCPGE